MNLKERIQNAIRAELEPLGFRYLKSTSDFKLVIDSNTLVFLGYVADCFHRGQIDVNLYPAACYQDIENVQYKLAGYSTGKNGHLRLTCRLQWLMPEGESAYEDFIFRERDSIVDNEVKLQKLLWRIKNYAIPYMERLSHKDSAIVEMTELDRKDRISYEGVVPIMHCLWKHDKDAALAYLEEKRQRMLKWVKPYEWELLARFREGERFGERNPLHALNYEDFIDFVDRFKVWMNEQ